MWSGAQNQTSQNPVSREFECVRHFYALASDYTTKCPPTLDEEPQRTAIVFEYPTMLDLRCEGLHYAVTRDQSSRVLCQHKVPKGFGGRKRDSTA